MSIINNNISIESGNIFCSEMRTIANPINTVGVMGAGLAKQFKARYPEMYKDYVYRCKHGLVKMGEPYLWSLAKYPHRILNFPTKVHWRDSSMQKHIDAGLGYLSANYVHMGIKSIALPALGCGLGGLERSDLEEAVFTIFEGLDDLRVELYI